MCVYVYIYIRVMRGVRDGGVSGGMVGVVPVKDCMIMQPPSMVSSRSTRARRAASASESADNDAYDWRGVGGGCQREGCVREGGVRGVREGGDERVHLSRVHACQSLLQHRHARRERWDVRAPPLPSCPQGG